VEFKVALGMTEKTNKASKKLTRRRFLDYLLGGSVVISLGSILGGILTFIYPPKKEGGAETIQRLEIGDISDLPEGKAKPVVFRGRNVMVMHVQEGFFAVDMKCTHLGCMVEWMEEKGVLFCPCHAAYFDYKGKVISGPAPSPLPLYGVEIAQGKIYVTRGA
jgi:cytochrome b6-f complex iron-sulfur subunit